ncbi:Calcium-binding 39 [Sigmodon hispidus]
MPFPFGKSHKSPADIVKNLKESMAVLEKQDISDKKAEKATEEVSKNLVAMKEIFTLVADLQLIDFEDLLTRHKLLSAEFLEQHYDRFFSEYEKLLHSENYVTKKQSLKLLAELLLDRHNFTIMTKYISKPENLKLMMNLLRDKS